MVVLIDNSRCPMNRKGIKTDFSNSMTYSDYLKLDTILSGQSPLSKHHDEMLFIIIHQASELWLKLILHELRSACAAISADNLDFTFKTLSRVSKILLQLTQSWDILSTLTPTDYLQFRDSLGSSSGFQSFQYRMIEYNLGAKDDYILDIYKHDNRLYQELFHALHDPSLYDRTLMLLHRRGLEIDDTLIKRDWSKVYQPSSSVQSAWLKIYRNINNHWDLYNLAEKLMDLDDGFSRWRFRHLITVERIIGFRQGTGGSSGVPYLKNVVEKRFFPELWSVRTEL